jgi:hypothetical protein
MWRWQALVAAGRTPDSLLTSGDRLAVRPPRGQGLDFPFG